MKKLIAFSCCLFVALAAQAQQRTVTRNNSLSQRVAAQTQRQVAKAQQAVSIPGPKRLVTVTLDVVDVTEDDNYQTHYLWHCPAVIFNKQGALAFDGECQEAITKAKNLPMGPVVRFKVDLGNLGEYTTGEEYGVPFYYESEYVAEGPGDEYTHSTEEAFRLSADRSYLVFRLSMFNDPTNENNPDNSEVKQAIARYYTQNNLREVTAEQLSAYFKAKHPTKRVEAHRSFLR